MFTSISCPSVEHCITIGSVAGGGPSSGAFSTATDNGGTSWSPEVHFQNNLGHAVSDISCTSTLNCVAAGGSTKVGNTYVDAMYYSTDGGTSWSAPVTLADKIGVYSISCFLPNDCVASGKIGSTLTGAGAVVYSTDGGATWSAPVVLAPAGLNGPLTTSCTSASACVVLDSLLLDNVQSTTTWYTGPVPAPVPTYKPLNGSPAVSVSSTPHGNGYWIAAANGDVLAFGSAGFYGSMANRPLTAPISHIVAAPDGLGYWLVASDGGVFAFGSAQFHGSMGAHVLNAPVVDLAPTPCGHGYWLVATDGGVFAFGSAQFHGSMGGHVLNAPVNAITSSKDAMGYRMVASDGGIFDFGAAQFHGSMGGHVLNAPIVGMSSDPSGGYRMVASDGGIFDFGAAQFHGSMGGRVLNAPIVAMTSDPQTGGYWMLASDGGIFSFDASFYGRGVL
ncbi:MAG: WD40/YVTN/BNR-like repeat-containing protein [Acidimicrobiales bacterium]